MKYLILILTVVASRMTYADVIEVNQNERTVYYQPNPVFEMTLQEIGDGTAALFEYLNYSSQALLADIEDLKSQYPGYNLQRVSARSGGVSELKIGELLTQEFESKDGQMGPFLNTSIMLTSEQTKALKKLGPTLANALRVPTNIAYISTQTIERYDAPAGLCNSLKVQNVKDLLGRISQMKKPDEIRNQQTFDSYKESIIEKCFAVNEQKVSSFADLLSIAIVTDAHAAIGGIYSAKKEISKTVTVQPKIKYIAQ